MRTDLQAVINVDHLVANYKALRACCKPGVKFCAPLKANAYGHGAALVAPALQKAGADMAAVATIDEAIELRDVGWTRPILVLGNVLAVADFHERCERLDAIIRHGLTITIADADTVRFLAEEPSDAKINVHLKIDTGLGRMGVHPDEASQLVREIVAARPLRLSGVYSHFGTADFADRDFALEQLATFKAWLSENAAALPAGCLRHIANSAATISLPEAHLDMVRPGISLFGYPPAEHLGKQIELRPTLKLYSHLTCIKDIPEGHSVGYARTFIAKRPTQIGIIPIGYADGFLRLLSNNAVVGTRHGLAPMIGRVSMDQIAVDLTDLPPLKLGDGVTLISDKPEDEHSVASLARRMGTIPYEVTCVLGRRMTRTVQRSTVREAQNTPLPEALPASCP